MKYSIIYFVLILSTILFLIVKKKQKTWFFGLVLFALFLRLLDIIIYAEFKIKSVPTIEYFELMVQIRNVLRYIEHIIILGLSIYLLVKLNHRKDNHKPI